MSLWWVQYRWSGDVVATIRLNAGQNQKGFSKANKIERVPIWIFKYKNKKTKLLFFQILKWKSAKILGGQITISHAICMTIFSDAIIIVVIVINERVIVLNEIFGSISFVSLSYNFCFLSWTSPGSALELLEPDLGSLDKP